MYSALPATTKVTFRASFGADASSRPPLFPPSPIRVPPPLFPPSPSLADALAIPKARLGSKARTVAAKVGRGIRAVGRNIKFAAKYPIVMFKTRHVRRQLAAAKRSRVAKANVDAKSIGARLKAKASAYTRTGIPRPGKTAHERTLDREAIVAARAARVKEEQRRFAERKRSTLSALSALSERAAAKARKIEALDRLSSAAADSARRKRPSPPPRKARPLRRQNGMRR